MLTKLKRQGERTADRSYSDKRTISAAASDLKKYLAKADDSDGQAKSGPRSQTIGRQASGLLLRVSLLINLYKKCQLLLVSSILSLLNSTFFISR